MTLTVEIAPEVESALAAQAARLGVAVERHAADVLQKQAASDGERPIAEFLSGAAQLRAQVLARGGSFEGASGADLVNAGRMERDARVLAQGREDA